MKNAEFVYAVVDFHNDDNNVRLKMTLDVCSIHKTLRDAEIKCAENNKLVLNAKPNPEYKRSQMTPSQNYIKINKNQPARWCYVKVIKIN